MEYLRGYRVIRNDPDWMSKLGLGSLLLFSQVFIPIIGPIVFTGWVALIMRRAVRGEIDQLPRLDFDFSYLGKLLGPGFKGFIVQFLWQLPLVFLFFALYMGAIVVSVIAMNESPSPEETSKTIMVIIALVMILVTPVSIVLAIPGQVAAMRAELTDELNAGLQFGDVLKFTKANFGVLLKGVLILSIVNGFLTLLGLLFCYVGAFPAMVVGGVARAHFLAQVYEQAVQKGAKSLPIASDDVMGVPGTSPAPG
ncbi:MAG: DUF4013 domain-containing protein [Myxococcota bacterium]